MRRALLGLVMLVGVTGCDFQAAFDDYCVETGRCDAGAADGGDAGVDDAGVADAGVTDAGVTDAGVTDAGVTDAGVTDAGATDAGAMDAGVTDAGVDGGLPTCEFTSLSWVGSSSAYVGECATGLVSHPRPDILPDSACSVPVVANAVPAGLALYGDGDCLLPARVNSNPHRLKASRFGVFSWAATASDARGTFSSVTYSFVAKASLALDAGTGKVQVGRCNPIQLVALSADGGIARAAQGTTVTVDFVQDTTFLNNCGATQFPADQGAITIGVNPPAIGAITVSVAGTPPFDSASTTVTACLGTGIGCSVDGDCCSNNCVVAVCL